MELRWMKAFTAVARELNYGRAAAALHVSQPAVSQQIRQLEKAVGVMLVDRSTRSVSLTRAGQAFLPLCVAALQATEEAVLAARNSQRDDRGVVRIGFAGTMGAMAVAQISRITRERFPGIELRFQASFGSAEVMELLAAGRLDIGFTAGQRSTHGVAMRTLREDPLGALVPPDHLIAGQESVELASLRDEGFVLLESALSLRLREEAIEACIDVGFRPRVVQDAPDLATLVALVASGSGISITAQAFAVNAPGTSYVPFSDVSRKLRTVIAWREAQGFGALYRVLEIIDEVDLGD